MTRHVPWGGSIEAASALADGIRVSRWPSQTWTREEVRDDMRRRRGADPGRYREIDRRSRARCRDKIEQRRLRKRYEPIAHLVATALVARAFLEPELREAAREAAMLSQRARRDAMGKEAVREENNRHQRARRQRMRERGEPVR